MKRSFLKKMDQTLLLTLICIMLLVSTFASIPIAITQSSSNTTVYVEPLFREVLINQTFSISVSITNVTDLYFWEFKLWYTTVHINATSVKEGPFLKAGDAKTTFGIFEMNDAKNATHGLVWARCKRPVGATGVNGDGVLAVVYFKATSLGSSNLLFKPVILKDPSLNVIACTATGGTVEVKPAVSPYGPKASFTVSPAKLYVDISVSFDASASEAGCNGTHLIPIAWYYWEFGDGATSNETDPIATHTYRLAGNYTVSLTVCATGATPETDTTTATIGLISPATVFIDPPLRQILVNFTFTVSVKIANVSNLYGYEFKLYYNTNVLDGISVDIPLDHFLKPTDPTKIFVAKLEINDVYNATHGCVWVALSLIAPELPKNGSGTLATITFKSIALGSSNLTFYYPGFAYPVKLSTRYGEPIPCAANGGRVSILFGLEHELIVTLDAPVLLELGDSSLLNATVQNFGLDNETDVELFLLVNDTIVDSATIPELVKGTSYALSYLWSPTVEATYNVTAYTPPVPGENVTVDNIATKMVNVRSLKGYILFDQTHGTDNIIDYGVWVTNLINRGHVVETHTAGPITIDVLAGYNVFIIPQAHDYYSSDELSAIQNFVLKGGGLLVIGDDEPYIYTDLTNFAGITWAVDGYGGNTGDITPHPVTEGVNLAYFGSPMSMMYVTSPAIDLIRDQRGYIMLAVSEVGAGSVIGIADENSINDWSISYADNLRLANNMIDWMVIQYEHDLTVSLEVPEFLVPGHSSELMATVRNRGLNNETDVELKLMINGSVVNSTVISFLPVDASYTLSYLWTPTVGATYNVTAYAVPVPGENITINNRATKLVVVTYPLIQPIEGQWANYTLTLYDPYRGVNQTIMMSLNHSRYITPYQINVTLTMQDPVTGQHQSGWMIVNIITRKVERDSGIYWAGMWYPGWIETSITLGSTINLLNGKATVVGSRTIEVNEYPVDCWKLLMELYGYEYTFWYDKTSGLWIGMEFTYDSYRSELTLVATNIPIGVLPVASFTYTPTDPVVGETVTFDASASYDLKGTIVSYGWDFGDGTTGTGMIVTHTYAAAGTYNVTLTVTDDEGLTGTTTAAVTISRATLDVEVDVGSIHFRGEIAEFYVLVSSMGEPVNASISAILYYNGTLYEDLSASVEPVTIGLYRVPYTIPTDAPTGTYVLVVKVSYFTLKGTSFKGFLLSPTLTGTLISLNGTVAWIKTDVGIIKTDIANIELRVTEINGNIATIQTTLGTIEGKITSIEGNIATIETDIGTVTADISAIKGAQGAQEAIETPLYVAIVPALIAAVGVILAIIFIRRKPRT